MDFVPNHTSDEHYWFIQSQKGIGKYKDYYTWRRGRSNNSEPPNNWISLFSGPAWTYVPSRDLWYFHQFEYRQPELNFSNPNVRQEMEVSVTIITIKLWKKSYLIFCTYKSRRKVPFRGRLMATPPSSCFSCIFFAEHESSTRKSEK